MEHDQFLSKINSGEHVSRPTEDALPLTQESTDTDTDVGSTDT
jgi:hypothetical protein